MSVESWLVFLTVWIAASIPLGPNALNCMASTAQFGLTRGLWSVVGVTLAACLHMSLAVSGIAAFMAANPILFDVLRWMGVAYLAWMGIGMLRSRGTVQPMHVDGAGTRTALLRRAVLISLSNPKAIFVWLAVFTQFLEPGASLVGQLLILAPTALAVTGIVYAGYAVLGTGVARIFSGTRKFWFDRIAGTTYLGFAAGLAFADLKRA